MFDLITNRLILYFVRRKSIRMASIYANQIHIYDLFAFEKEKEMKKCFINEKRRKNRLYFTIYYIK